MISFWFKCIVTCHPYGKSHLNRVPNIRVQHILCFEIFLQLYFINYIKDVIIPETSKHLKYQIVIREYFCFIVCLLIMAFYIRKYVRDLFLKHLITPKNVPPIRLNNITSVWRLDKITQAISCKNRQITAYDDPFFQQQHMEEMWNGSTVWTIVVQCYGLIHPRVA